MPSTLLVTYHSNLLKQQGWSPDWIVQQEISASETAPYPVLLEATSSNDSSLKVSVSLQTNSPWHVELFINASGPVLLLQKDAHCHFVLPGGHFFGEGLEAHFDGALSVALKGNTHCAASKTPQQVTNQAMILAAGFATRLEPIAGELTGLPKPALPLALGESVISTMAKHLCAFGIERLIVNTSFLPDAVKASLAAANLGVEILYIDEAQPSGTAGGLLTAFEQGLVDKTQPILVVQGDAVSDFDIGALLQAHQKHEARVTIGVQTVCDEDVHKFGIVETAVCDAGEGDATEIKAFKEKPSLDEAGACRCANTGFYVLSPQVYDLFVSLGRQCRSRQTGLALYDFAQDFFPSVLSLSREETANTGKMMAYALEGYWADIGNAAQYYQTLCELGHMHLADDNGVLTLTRQVAAPLVRH